MAKRKVTYPNGNGFSVCSPTEITVEELIRQLKEAGCKNPMKATVTSESDLVCYWPDDE